MTWSKAENIIIDALVKQSEATAKNVREIKEAIVGSLREGKPGLQDKVREMRTDVDINRDRIVAHKKADGRDHKFMKRAILGVGLFTLIALILNFDKAGPMLGGLIKLIIKILT